MNKLVPFFAVIFTISFSIIPGISAETQIDTSSGGSLDVKIELDNPQPGEQTKLKIDFLKPRTDKIQEHVDYTVNILNNEDTIFGPIPLTHTSLGSVSIPVSLEDGTNKITIQMEGILFVPIAAETVSFDVIIGESAMESGKIPAWVKSNAEWWAKGSIDDDTFVSGIQFLIREEIISVSSQSTKSGNDEIPGWIKNNADWWAKGLISDDDFLKGIEYLVENGIISVAADETSESKLNIGGVDLSQASPMFGSSDADVTIIEFGDYQCPNCKKWFLNTKPDILTNYIDTGKANLYFVDLAFLGDDSLPAAAATYCADEQGLYWEYHSYLYSHQRGIDSGWADHSSLKDYAKILGLDEDSFADCMDSGKYNEAVLQNLEIGIKNGIKGTPSFVVVGPNGQEFISGPQPYPVFQSVIDSVLES